MEDECSPRTINSHRRAAKQAEQVNGRLVSPVEVLKHDHRRARSRRRHSQQGVEHRPGPASPRNQHLKIAAHRRRDINERTERPWRNHRIACPDQNARIGRLVVQEAPDECGLPDPGLAAHQSQPSPTHYCLGKGVAQDVQRGLALNKLHQREIMPVEYPRSNGAPSC